ncbi:Cu/Ag efflux pump CusA [Alkalibacillus flavidus]|uniref:Cu/Ag efflux pump CusA n=1 Tax=Alkalibacillus flavidus TaxID=546021 RepID=A0ABV2KX02_9BACI
MSLAYYIALSVIIICVTIIWRMFQLQHFIRFHIFLIVYAPLALIGGILLLFSQTQLLLPKLLKATAQPLFLLSLFGIAIGWGCLHLIQR